jgi:hypothetical protein
LIGITDLHCDNLILQDDVYYPIDLETINTNYITGLYGNTETGVIKMELLNEASLKLIEDFNRKLYLLPNRFLPINTLDFTKFINDDGISINKLVHIFTTNKLSTYSDTNILKKYFLDCKKKRIIPYFLLKNGEIFYYNIKYHNYSKIPKINCKSLTRNSCISTKGCKYKKNKCSKKILGKD